MLAAALIFVMHEQMHQRTGEKQQPGQPGQHKPKMRTVFGEEIKSAENTKPTRTMFPREAKKPRFRPS